MAAPNLGIDTSANPHVTRSLANWSSSLGASAVTPISETWAKHCLLDWFGVTIAGAREPLADIIAEEFKSGASGQATLIARGAKASTHDAALVNGTLSHALDYDDVNALMGGHPSVPVAAAALALGETMGASGRDILHAFIAGYEVECRLGEMSGADHYDLGFHATGTFGTFGATAAAARLLGLDAERTAHALGIAASQASGLKINFGTMTKPLHVGKAAMNGLISAKLAARDFSARTDAIEAPQGFAQTQAPNFVAKPMRPDQKAPFAVEQNLFKYHAACYLTHSSIEAIRDLKRRHNIGPDDVEAITLHVDDGHLKVCNIPDPKSGLEIKFAIRHLVGMALDGADTAALGTYSDEAALDPRYVALRDRIQVQTSKLSLADKHGAAVNVKLKDGRALEAKCNVGIPSDDVAAQQEKLESKFHALADPVIGRQRTKTAIGLIQRFETLPNLKGLMEAVA